MWAPVVLTPDASECRRRVGGESREPLVCGEFARDARSRSTVARMPRRLALAAAPLVLLVASLGACAESVRIPPAEPSSATQPLFATDEEALEAATAAYEEFLQVSGQILREGGADPERLRPLVSDAVYQSVAEGFATLDENGWRAIGNSMLLGVELQQHQVGPPGEAELVTYVCVSVADNDIVNSYGQSQAAQDRLTEVSFEVVFLSTVEGNLIIDRKIAWNEAIAC